MTDILADPFVQTGLLAVIGALVTRILLRNHPTRRLIGQSLFFVALTALLLAHGIVPYEPAPPEPNLQRVFIGLAKIIWWTNAAWFLISIVRVFLIFERTPREGRLLQDLVVGIIYVGAILSVMSYVFDAPIGTLMATSGVVAVILGLAMQSSLSDVFSGIALNLSRPYGVGDWLVLANGIEGKVVETNWRATHLLNGVNDLVIVPNNDLAKARLTNMSSPDRTHGMTIAVRFRPTVQPAIAADVMRSVLLSSDIILTRPEPSVQITDLDAAAVRLELFFHVADISLIASARSEVLDLVYRHSKAAGLILAAPLEGSLALMDSKAEEAPAQHRTTQLRLLDAIPIFASLTEDEKEALAATMTRRTFRKDEILVKQGDVLTSLMVLRTGVAAVTQSDHMRETELGRLAPGNFFGEVGLLTGAGELTTVRALTFVVVYEISQASLAGLMHDRPAIAEELGTILAKRTAHAKHVLEQGSGHRHLETVPSVVARIRDLFNLRT
ncbi:cyclic nucleotide-binding domain-containing protein [Methylovirgula sp. 4M-Z18]|uniref:cyclic nucleotide-binding domain-containing protein n=1 Tax=Methylovirgula sp. 4M-Z18 TaxID=2293567 RepID=UPI000E2E5DFE|nr:mechanosensitive ion channel family protein [Methylovirgula sp. 4M-Z18]RFB80931.1 mechanosensitive ion channel protein [Methylovirgula sp. 4M-Z18]